MVVSEDNGELEGSGYTYTVTTSRNVSWDVVLRAIPTEGGVLITKDCVDGSAFDGREKLILGGLTFVPHEVEVDHLPENQDQIIAEMNQFAEHLVSTHADVELKPDFESMTLSELKKYAKEKGVFVGNKKRKRLVSDLTDL